MDEPVGRAGAPAAAEERVDVRLIAGVHLRPGARYRFCVRDEGDHTTEAAESTTDVTVAEWNPSATTVLTASGNFVQGEDAYSFDGTLSTHAQELPPRIRATGELRVANGALAWLRGASVTAGADFSSTAKGTAPVTVELTHRLVRAKLALTPISTSEGVSRVTVLVIVRGRRWARPLVAVGAWCMRGTIAREVDAALTEVVSTVWNPLVQEADLPAELARAGALLAGAAQSGDHGIGEGAG
ncbi:hypothetical protein [Nocardiopsis ansamitocini]|uniref:Uncharacterized protein n=1 Tax=Nocardiopsis ansamitocini TaxID=1670832 RepID=A0A9W6P398_9ACTN|nr:hypothetical protein [Nocardiopsis ansamitocini]GLU46361.1 hypothetical protein Nans01_07120 [Nocardiopsis ansamitocini]